MSLGFIEISGFHYSIRLLLLHQSFITVSGFIAALRFGHSIRLLLCYWGFIKVLSFIVVQGFYNCMGFFHGIGVSSCTGVLSQYWVLS